MSTDPTVSELPKEQTKGPPLFAARLALAASRHRIVGGLGAIAVVMNMRHELGIISGPFASCHSLSDIIARLTSMEDATFLGVMTAGAILVAPIFMMTWAIIGNNKSP